MSTVIHRAGQPLVTQVVTIMIATSTWPMVTILNSPYPIQRTAVLSIHGTAMLATPALI